MPQTGSRLTSVVHPSASTSASPHVAAPRADDEASTRVTQQDVARAAGVHNSTVSLALRGYPTISAATRDRVRRIAASMGYTPDPAVQALVAYRNRLSRRHASAAIAFVTRGANEFGWRADPAAHAFFLGARTRATELGYHLDHFWAGEAGLSQRRLSQVLFHRGIVGALILSGGEAPQDWSELEWPRLCAVAVGGGDLNPAIHRVMSDPSGHVRLAFRRAREAGYRRPCVVLPASCDEASGSAWTHALAAERCREDGGAQVPLFVLRGEEESPRGAGDDASGELETERLAQWLARHEPDLVVGWSASMRPRFERLGLRVPRDIAFLDIDCDEAGAGIAGVRQNHRAVGLTAVDLVVHRLQQHLYGVPDIPTRTLIEGVWCEGASMPQLHAAARRRGRSAADLEASIA